MDGSGNVYIADTTNDRIRKVNTSGIISTFAGTGAWGFGGDGGSATSSLLARPRGVAVDGSGNVYIADTWNHRIRKVTHWGSSRHSRVAASEATAAEASEVMAGRRLRRCSELPKEWRWTVPATSTSPTLGTTASAR